MSSISRAGGAVAHSDDHIICIKKPDASKFSKGMQITSAIAGTTLAAWGTYAMIAKALAVGGFASAFFAGAGLVLIALAAIIWVGACYLQHKSNKEQVLRAAAMSQRNIELQSQAPQQQQQRQAQVVNLADAGF